MIEMLVAFCLVFVLMYLMVGVVRNKILDRKIEIAEMEDKKSD